MRISDWSSDVCSSDLADSRRAVQPVVHPDHLPLVQHRRQLAAGRRLRHRAAGRLPRLRAGDHAPLQGQPGGDRPMSSESIRKLMVSFYILLFFGFLFAPLIRSEEHTSELQSLMRISYAVFCLTKKKNKL